MPGLQEWLKEGESSDDDSNDDSTKEKYRSMPSLLLRARNNSNSSSEDSDSDREDSKIDNESDELNLPGHRKNWQQSPPPTNYISSWDFGDSDNNNHSLDNKPEEEMPYLATRYNIPADTKPLRMRGGYNNDDNDNGPNKPGIMRV